MSKGVILASACLLFLIMLGFNFQATGIIFGLVLLAIMAPWFLILRSFALNSEESLVGSFFFGIVLTSALVYWPSFILGIRNSFIAVEVVLACIALAMHHRKQSGSLIGRGYLPARK